MLGAVPRATDQNDRWLGAAAPSTGFDRLIVHGGIFSPKTLKNLKPTPASRLLQQPLHRFIGRLDGAAHGAVISNDLMVRVGQDNARRLNALLRLIKADHRAARQ